MNFGVWNRDAVGDTNIASSSLVQNNAAATPQASHVDTRLAGFQYGLDAGLFNINNSGFNTHLGVTVGDVFTSSTDHANPGVTSSAEIPFVGAYGALTGKGFAGIVGVRYDRYNLSLTNPIENVRNQASGRAWADVHDRRAIRHPARNDDVRRALGRRLRLARRRRRPEDPHRGHSLIRHISTAHSAASAFAPAWRRRPAACCCSLSSR